MKMHRILTVGFLAALAIALGGATLRSKTPTPAPTVQAPVEAPSIAASDGDYVWDPVDRYWERDHNGR